MRVFISYSHKQGAWVLGTLVPVLKAAGAEVIIDKDRFTAGLAVYAQMNEAQDMADLSLLVLSPDYDQSAPCRHERDRAIASDPTFQLRKVIPVVRIAGADTSPFQQTRHQTPLWVNLTCDREADKWALLLKSLSLTRLGCCAAHWLEVRNELIAKVNDQGLSVNLVVKNIPNWRHLIDHLANDHMPRIGVIDLDNPCTISRKGLVIAILAASGQHLTVPLTEDLVALNALGSLKASPIIVIQHFDIVLSRGYGDDLFHTIRFLMESRKLVLLIVSRRPYRELVPLSHQLSTLPVQDVELHGFAAS